MTGSKPTASIHDPAGNKNVVIVVCAILLYGVLNASGVTVIYRDRVGHCHLGPDRLAPGKKTPRLKAWLVFIDESAFLTAPLVRHGWALCGQTPVIRQRTRSHRKVSGVGALCIAPERDRLAHRAAVVRDFLKTHPHIRLVFRPPYAPELNPIEYH